MANEFVARNGLIAQDSSTITGSLTVTNGIVGSLTGTASYATNANLLDGLDSSVFTSTASFNAYTSSNDATVTSVAASTALALASIATLTSRTGSYTTTSSFNSYTSSNDATVTSVAQATVVNAAGIASLASRTGSYATTGSNTFIGTQTITGSVFGSGSLTINGCITATGQIVAQTINVQQVTSSIVYSCGSNVFGTAISNIQQLTGSVGITGSLALVGSMVGSSTMCSVMVNASCIGIGTTSPSTTLDVNGTGRFGSAATKLTTYSDSAYSGIFNGASLGSNESIYMGDGRMFFFASGSERIRLTSTGLGIGTTSPAAKFHVSNGGQYGIEIDVENEIIQAYNRTSAEYQEIKLYSSNLRFFNGTSSTITERMRITSGGLVGIGTSSPGNYYSTKLVVAVGDEDGITIAGGGDNFLMFADGQTGLDRYRGFIHYSHDSNFLAFGSDGAERMRITSGGLVNIGTTTAYTSRLNVQSTSPSVAAIKAGYGGIAGNGYTILADNYTTNESLMAIGIDYSSGGLVLGSAMAPSTTNQGCFISTQAQFGGFGSAIRLSTSGEILFYRGTQDSIISTGNAKAAAISLFINNSGNVGIGTTSPGTKLDVWGTIRTTITSGFYTDFTYTGTTYNFGVGEQTDNVDFKIAGGSGAGWTSGGNFRFFTQTGGATPTERMRISSAGSVGIGTTSTSAEANLFLGAKSTIEGGQMVFQKGTSCSCATHLDNYSDQFRVLVGDDTGSNGVHMLIDHRTRSACFYGAVLSSAPNNGYNFRALGFSTGAIAGGGSCLVYSSLDRGLYLISISSSVTSTYGYSAFLWVDSSNITVSSVIRQACVAITTSGRALTVVNQYTAEAAAMTISTLNLVNYLGA